MLPSASSNCICGRLPICLTDRRWLTARRRRSKPIGTDLNYDWLKLPLVHLHWYDKDVREGRKVGHLNLNDSDTGRLAATLEALVPLLPAEYASGVIWAQSKFG
ncbi:hypothetical protein ACLK2H_03070 [Escherichia coli]